MNQELKPCPFCGGEMMLREALWPSEGDTDGIIHVAPTDCPLPAFDLGVADSCVSVSEAWNRRAATPSSKAEAPMPDRIATEAWIGQRPGEGAKVTYSEKVADIWVAQGLKVAPVFISARTIPLHTLDKRLEKPGKGETG